MNRFVSVAAVAFATAAFAVGLPLVASADNGVSVGNTSGGWSGFVVNGALTQSATAKPGDSVSFDAAIVDASPPTTGQISIRVAADQGAMVSNGGTGGASGCATPGPDITCTYPLDDFGPPGPSKGDAFHINVPQNATGTITVTVTVTDANGSDVAPFKLTINQPQPSPSPSPSASPTPGASSTTTPGLPNTGAQ